MDKGRTNKSTSSDQNICYHLGLSSNSVAIWGRTSLGLIAAFAVTEEIFLDLLVLEPVSLSITKKSGIMLEQLSASSILNSLMPLLDGRSYFQQ